MNRLKPFYNFTYAWDLIHEFKQNKNIIKVNILLNNNNYLVPISKIDVSKFIFKRMPYNSINFDQKRIIMHIIYFKYEDEDEKSIKFSNIAYYINR
jgi:hypothetical protein